MQDLKGKVAVITGGASGIGLATARSLAREGVRLVLADIEVSSLELIETYVANGFGVGVAVVGPRPKLGPGVRVVSLPGFAPVVLGALWRGKSSALLQAFLDEMQVRAKRLA